MKSRIKKNIIVILITVLVLSVLFIIKCITFSGTDYKHDYKELFAKVFSGGYTIEKTHSELEWYPVNNGRLVYPSLDRMYSLTYTDHKGTQREITMSSTAHPFWGMTKEQWNEYDDSNVAHYIDGEECSIAKCDMCDDILSRYFSGEITYENSSFIDGRAEIDCGGYTVSAAAYDGLAMAKDPQLVYYDKDLLEDSVSPENRTSLNEFDLKSFACKKNCVMQLGLVIYDEELYSKADGLQKKLEDSAEEYASLSDFGGNYIITVYHGEKDELGTVHYLEEISKKSVVFGEDITEKCEKDTEALRESIFEKNGI